MSENQLRANVSRKRLAVSAGRRLVFVFFFAAIKSGWIVKLRFILYVCVRCVVNLMENTKESINSKTLL